MLHLNAKIRERHGLCSRQAMQSFLRDPELYFAQNIEEIKLQRLKPTQNKFLSPGKGVLDKSVIFLSRCSLELMEERVEIAGLEQERDQLHSFIKTVPNAFLSDASGKLPIICPFPLEEKMLENILVFYYHRLGIYRLEHAEQMPTKNKMTRMVLQRVYDLKESSLVTSTDN